MAASQAFPPRIPTLSSCWPLCTPRRRPKSSELPPFILSGGGLCQQDCPRMFDPGKNDVLYRGETSRFNFEKFIDRQKECYKKLCNVGYNNGVGVNDASKFSNLRQMILPKAQLEIALSMARIQGLFNGPFNDLVHFLKAEVDELVLRHTQVRANRSHCVSSIGMNGCGGRGGRGRGDRWNQQSRFQPRGNRSRPVLNRYVDGRQVHSGNYSPEEYRRLTQSNVKPSRRFVNRLVNIMIPLNKANPLVEWESTAWVLILGNWKEITTMHSIHLHKGAIQQHWYLQV